MDNAHRESLKRVANGTGDECDLQLKQLRDEAGFHWKDDVFFRRLEDGSVRVRHFSSWNYHPNCADWIVTPSEWASIVASVSASGENIDSFRGAESLHSA